MFADGPPNFPRDSSRREILEIAIALRLGLVTPLEVTNCFRSPTPRATQFPTSGPFVPKTAEPPIRPQLQAVRDCMERRSPASGRLIAQLVTRLLQYSDVNKNVNLNIHANFGLPVAPGSRGPKNTAPVPGIGPTRADQAAGLGDASYLISALPPELVRLLTGALDGGKGKDAGIGWLSALAPLSDPIALSPPEDPLELASIAWMDDWEQRTEKSPDVLKTDLPNDDSCDSDVAVAASDNGFLTEENSECRYQVLRRLARGGLGEVFVAKDRELNRLVALKRLQPENSQNRVNQRRLEMEAVITGVLEHPGIVPVYGMGTDANNKPFYSMRLVRGVTMRDAIRSSDSSAPASGKPAANGVTRDDASAWDNAESPPSQPWTQRRLLSRLLSVCETMSYVHEQGFWHRDLKPENILLGCHGETLVLDWGLARPFRSPARSRKNAGPNDADASHHQGGGPADSDSGADNGAENPAYSPGACPKRIFSIRADARNTGGVRIKLAGTPSYMSPEQANGEQDPDGALSDVYSLGATLYHILTKRAPFQGWAPRETVMLVRQGLVPRPRQLNRNIDPALEAICLKAMEYHPKDRYPSAQAMADDIERHLAEEPVTVYREPLSRQLSRWERRHRPWLAGCIAVLAISVLGLILGSFALKRERDRTDLARLDAVAARDRGEDSHRRARAAIKTYLETFSEKLRDQSGVQPIRRQLLSQAVDYYQRLLADNSDNPDDLSSDESAEIFFALVGLGTVQEELGEISKAQATYLRAIPMAQRMLVNPNAKISIFESDDPNPVRTEIQIGLAQAYNNYGNLLLKFRKLPDAVLHYRNSQQIYESLASAKGRPYVDREIARTWNNLASCYNQMRDYSQAAACYEKAVILYENDASKDEIRYLHDFAALRSNYCDCLLFLKDTDRAYKELTQSHALIQKILMREPQNPWYRHLGNFNKCIEARYYADVGNSQRCLAAWDAAWTGQKQLVQENQDVEKFRMLYFQISKDITSAYAIYKRNDKALIERIYRDWIQSAALPVPVADAGDLDPDWVLNSFQSRGLFAVWLNQNRQFQSALEILENLRNEADQLPRGKWSDSAKTVFAAFQNGAYVNIAMALDGLGRFPEAGPYWRRAMDIDDSARWEQVAQLFLVDSVRSGNFRALQEFRASVLKKGDRRGQLWYNLALAYTYKFLAQSPNIKTNPNVRGIADAAEPKLDLQDAGSAVLLCLQRARYLGWFRSDVNRRGFLAEPLFSTFRRDRRFVQFALDVFKDFAFP